MSKQPYEPDENVYAYSSLCMFLAVSFMHLVYDLRHLDLERRE